VARARQRRALGEQLTPRGAPRDDKVFSFEYGRRISSRDAREDFNASRATEYNHGISKPLGNAIVIPDEKLMNDHTIIAKKIAHMLIAIIVVHDDRDQDRAR